MIKFIRVYWKELLVALFLTIVNVLFLFAIFLLYGYTEKGIRIVIYWTGITGTFFFSLSFVATSFNKCYQNALSLWILNKRLYFGPIFGVMYLMQLFFLGILQNTFHVGFNATDVLFIFVGIGAYLFIIAMLVTTPKFIARLLPFKSWKRFHFVGAHWIWIYLISYYCKEMLNDFSFALIVILLLTVMLIRVKAKKYSMSVDLINIFEKK